MMTDIKCVLAIGNFDGVHRGHAGLLAAARKVADGAGLPLRVLTFEPHPRQFFKPDAAPFRITLEPARTRRLRANSVDDVQVLAFDAALASTSAEDFINDIILRAMNAVHVVVGSDFHFGRGRAGHVDTLQADGRFTVTALPLVADGSDAVSSTRIRSALAAGNISEANKLLGWDWAIEGVVVHGDKRGREIGFPTANIPLGDTLCPAHGIYAAWVDIGDGQARPAAVSVGLRPMFAVAAPLLEAYLLDFDGDLYGKTLSVRPVRFLRGEEKFDGIEALKTQIALDCKAAADILISPAR